jgi:hypothetical protein
VCECVNETCVDRVALTLSEYEGIRQVPTRFVVVPSRDHLVPDVEQVVKADQRYWVVEKEGLAGAVAEALNPRAVA